MTAILLTMLLFCIGWVMSTEAIPGLHSASVSICPTPRGGHGRTSVKLRISTSSPSGPTPLLVHSSLLPLEYGWEEEHRRTKVGYPLFPHSASSTILSTLIPVTIQEKCSDAASSLPVSSEVFHSLSTLWAATRWRMHGTQDPISGPSLPWSPRRAWTWQSAQCWRLTTSLSVTNSTQRQKRTEPGTDCSSPMTPNLTSLKTPTTRPTARTSTTLPTTTTLGPRITSDTTSTSENNNDIDSAPHVMQVHLSHSFLYLNSTTMDNQKYIY